MNEVLSITPQMMVVCGLLALTIFLFVSEIVRVDVAAISIMVLLGLLSLIPALDGLVDTRQLFSGFSSNAVISIIAVMILGAGLDKTGVMSRVAGFIMRIGGHTERRLMPLLSGTAGVMSGFIQNVGAAALFLPVVSRVCARTGLAMSRLLIPMGFCAIMGGTLTMVGSSPLILLNDLMPTGMAPFALFDVTPIGLALIVSGIAYFSVMGRFVLPSIRTGGASGESTMQYFQQVYGLDFVIREARLTPDSKMAGRVVGDIEKEYGVVIVATFIKGELRVGPWSGLTVEPRAHLALLGHVDTLRKLCASDDLHMFDRLDLFAESLSHVKSGIAEVVIPPSSTIIGKTVTELAMRKTYGMSVLAIHRGEETIRKGRRDVPLQAGDTLACHCAWNALARLEKDRDFVVVTSEYPHEELRPQKVSFALAFFLLAMGLVVFTDLRLSIALLTGAVGMILTGVLTMDEAYAAVSWRTVFLLASLIPLGMAVENTGTAAWLAQQILELPGVGHPLLLLAAIAVLATAFTLVMSNVGATVLLVPLAVHIALAAQALGMEADPRVFALTVAIMTSNAFLIPTHQVNALIMGPGGYRVKDFMKAGGGMSIVFLVVGLLVLKLLY